MLLLGHIGITLGTAVLLSGVLGSSSFSNTGGNEAVEPSSNSFKKVQITSDFQGHKKSWITALGRRLDIRLLLMGSILPDIIDKPIGFFFFRETFSNGRIFCHTLLFPILVTFAGLNSFKRQNKIGSLTLSFGILMHLILDKMWRTPKTLLWPLLGFDFEFERTDVSNWIENMFHSLFTDPETYVPEQIGAVILTWFAREKAKHAKH